MTLRVVNVPDGDYKIKTQSGGTITLDTGVDTGLVFITGDLLVQGETTTVNTTILNVEDNIITVNSGETDFGISITNGFVSGLEVDRGQLFNASFLFDEQISHRNNLGVSTPGTFKLENAIGAGIGLKTPSIVVGTNEKLYLINQGTGWVTVTGTNDYEKQILNYTNFDLSIGPVTIGSDPDALVNVQALVDYVTGATSYSPSSFIVRDDTSVRCYDINAGDASTKIQIKVNNITEAEITANGLFVNDVRIHDNIVTTQNTNADLVMRSATSLIELDGYLILRDKTALASTQTGTSALFSTGTLGPGDSGIYFVNSRSDELVSKRRAILFSYIF